MLKSCIIHKLTIQVIIGRMALQSKLKQSIHRYAFIIHSSFLSIGHKLYVIICNLFQTPLIIKWQMRDDSDRAIWCFHLQAEIVA